MKKESIFFQLLRYSFLPIIGVIINYWISHSSDDSDIIKFLNETRYVLNINMITAFIIVYILVLTWSDVSKYMKTKENNKIEEIRQPLIEQIKELKLQLSSKAGSLIDSFSELQHFQEKEVLMKHLQEFTDNHEVIHSVQVYTYSKKIKEDKFSIKVSYMNGYAYDGIDINAIIQTYYEMDVEIYHAIMTIMEIKNEIDRLKMDNNIDSRKANMNVLNNLDCELKSKLSDFITENRKKINEKDIDDLTVEDSILFALLELCVELYIDNKLDAEALDGLWQLQITDLAEKDDKLRKLKRTGILNGIFKINTHKFKNKGYSNKRDRIYITRCFKLNNLNCIMCLSLIPSTIEFCDLYDALTLELIDDLNIDFDVCYNN